MASAGPGPNVFLSESSPCGLTLLRLVARGNSIIAELLRLADNIPLPFLPGQTDPTHAKYGVLLFDFKCAPRAAAAAAAAPRPQAGGAWCVIFLAMPHGVGASALYCARAACWRGRLDPCGADAARYLKTPELYDSKINNDAVLSDLDEEFQETFEAICDRFYKLFNNVFVYVSVGAAGGGARCGPRAL